MDKMKAFFSDLTPKKKIGLGVAAAAVVALIVGLIVLLIGGGGNNNNTESGGSEGKSGVYSIELITVGGKVFEGIDIYVYTDETKSDLLTAGRTDENGKFEFEAENAKGAVVVLKDMPRGYKLEDTYTIKDVNTKIELETELLSTDELADVQFELGDVFADMSVTTADGKTYKISELLKEKKAVVLNFWYLNCQPCKNEFPFLQEAYNKYKDKLEILAVNPVDGDNESITEFQKNLGLSLPMGKCDESWAKTMKLSAYPTTVVIDRYGTIAFKYGSSVDDSATFEKVFEYFTADDYKQTTIKSIDDIAELGEADGSAEYPFDVFETKFDASVKAGQVVYYQMYKVDGMILSIDDPDAFIIIGDEEYYAQDGLVTAVLSTPDTYTPAIFAIGNKGNADKTFKASVDFKQGALNNPYALTMGEFVANTEAGNEQGVYYKFTATAAGEFTVTLLSATEGITYDFNIYNLTTSVMRNMSSDGAKDANGNMTLTVSINAGDEIQFSVGTLPDEQNEYPAGEFKFKASFTEATDPPVVEQDKKADYTVTVKNSEGNVLSGVTVTFSGAGMESKNVTTSKKGVATLNLVEGDYTAVVTAPNGYQTDTTAYQLTVDKKSVTVTLKAKTTEKKTYTVTVQDESGKAMSDVLVTVGDAYAKTDSKGKVTFSLVVGSYTASAEAPSGYASASKAFGSATSVTITLKKQTVEEPDNTKTYTVNVEDYAGNPIKDAAVSFVSGSTTVKTVVVGTNGKATASLEAGNYTVQIKFPNGKDYGYDKSTAKLTAKKTTTTIVAAVKISESKKTELYGGEYSAYTLSTGGVYVEIQADGQNFFVFEPTKAGKYRIKTTNSDAKVAYAGSTMFFNTNPAFEKNEYTTNITESMIGNELVFSVSGASECVLIVERYGSADEGTKPTVYKGSDKIPSGYATPEKVTYVDLTGSGINLVKGDDGYYHKDSATGPIVYVDLTNEQYISLTGLVSKTSFLKYFYKSNGTIEKIEEYTELMIQYTDAAAKTKGKIPLTDDLKYMIQNGGDHRGWWDKNKEGGFYLFEGQKVNTEIAWMFALCY